MIHLSILIVFKSTHTNLQHEIYLFTGVPLKNQLWVDGKDDLFAVQAPVGINLVLLRRLSRNVIYLVLDCILFLYFSTQ